VILADSRRGLRGFPKVGLKMNRDELERLVVSPRLRGVTQAARSVSRLARDHGQPVFVTMAAQGMLGAGPDGKVYHVAAWPVSQPIDIVGAGDAVTANLLAALAAGATLPESMILANAAASIVIHQLGTTGTASVPQLRGRLFGGAPMPMVRERPQ
jgi:sugar/nucleoside kinase (ribokinase family)